MFLTKCIEADAPESLRMDACEVSAVAYWKSKPRLGHMAFILFHFLRKYHATVFYAVSLTHPDLKLPKRYTADDVTSFLWEYGSTAAKDILVKLIPDSALLELDE